LALEGGLSVTRGIISGTNRTVNTNTGSSLQGMLQTDAAINPGNSGGPLLDANARVIGINTAIADPGSSQDVSYAIPISSANPIIADLRLGREPAFLGVSTQSVTAALDRELSLGLTSGAYVDKVTASSAAKDAGLKVGDVITKIDGSKITDSTDVLTAIRGNRPGETISITINRKGEEITVQAKLTGRPS
jgi:S1-C subfamily serine protease